MIDAPYSNTEDPRYEIRLISMVSLGMFLFLLFFRPFGKVFSNAEEQLVFDFGIAAIAFLVMLLLRLIVPVSVTERIKAESIKISNEVGLILLIWLLVTVANVFYLRYFGKVTLSLFTILKIILFSAIPSVILKLADVNRALRVQLRQYVRRNLQLEKNLADLPDHFNSPVFLQSETKKDQLKLNSADIILCKAADNYVEVVFREDDETRQAIIRNTMKNIVQQLGGIPDFLRCHRSWIVNRNYMVNLTNSYKGHRLKLLDFDEEIPVSRQYLNLVREALTTTG